MNAIVDRQCWCGAVKSRIEHRFDLDDGSEFTLVRCEGCGVFALHPQPTDAQLLKAYATEYYGSSRRKFVAPVAALVSWFQGGRARLAARFAPRGGSVLDVGCGNGGFLMQMTARGYRIEGTEWSAASAARVPSDLGIPIHIGDLLTLDLPEASFDLVTLWHVFEHLRQPHETLKKIRNLLKPQGHLILSLPNAESRQARRFGAAWFHHDPPRHLFGFGPNSLRRLLDSSGFQAESINTFSLEQNPYGWIQSMLNRRSAKRDRLYSTLKGTSKLPMSAKMIDLMCLSLLAAPAIAISSVESLAGRGATMTVVARSRI